MSGLFNSYVIEPALRQARRFSTSHDPDHGRAARAGAIRQPSPAGTGYLDLAQLDSPPSDSAVTSRTQFASAAGSRHVLPPSPVATSPGELRGTDRGGGSAGEGHTFNPGVSEVARQHGSHSRTRLDDMSGTYPAPGGNPAAQSDSLWQPAPSPGVVHSPEHVSSEAQMVADSIRSLSLGAAPTQSSNPTQRVSQHLQRSTDSSSASSRPGGTGTDNTHGGTVAAIGRARHDSGSSSSVMSGVLPANDGMAELRRKVHLIRDMALSSEEKAKRMHDLMTADYEHFRALQINETKSAQLESLEASAPVGLAQRLRSPSPASTASFHDPDNPFNVNDSDLESSYCPPSPVFEYAGLCSPELEDPIEYEPEHGCKHYKRHIKVQCHDCRRWYTCRLCHDEATDDHQLDRKKIKNMLCMNCKTPQAAAEYCKECGQLAANYYCDVCKLWDNDARRRIYHCDDCGICRRGEGLGKDYVHCKKCNVCISIAFATTHRCVERATDCDCPICGEYLFTSSASVVAMQCGHYIHRVCFDAYMESSYRCPICNRSAVNMELQWRKLDRSIQVQPMPEQYRDTKVWITCNDCTARTCVAYHWLGNKCAECDGYNTNEVKMISPPEGTSDMEESRLRRESEEHHAPLVRELVQQVEEITRPSEAGSELIGSSLSSTAGANLRPARAARAARVSFSQVQPTRQQHGLGEAGVARTAVTTSTASIGSALSDHDEVHMADVEDSGGDDEGDGDEASFWGESISPSTWNLNMPRPASLLPNSFRANSDGLEATSPTSEGGRFFSGPRSWGSPRIFDRSPLARARSADAVPRPEQPDADDSGADVMPSRESVGGWGIGPGLLWNRMQAFGRDTETVVPTEGEGEASGWDWRRQLSNGGWTSPKFLATRFGRAITDTEGDANSAGEELSEDESSVEGDARDGEAAAEEEEGDDAFGLPGHR
ncbi:hypothetical protein FH972_026302 [Carpinus fangiana]|uniref:RING-type domain-containing protein n=1 Tax=Carpinus fangiana TaxID=176857 RepID=A0A5N6L3K7_9ROSI|nr:hypothetical protein FH972_026302 [Carpinus fangiana]